MKKKFELIEDRYDGVTLYGNTIEYSVEEFEEALLEFLSNLKDKKLFWIKLLREHSEFIPLLIKNDFVFHHCDENSVMLVKKLIKDPIIPTAKNHTLGVGVVVIHKNMLLVIKDRINQVYKLPGGFIDDRESISQASEREVFEETGVRVKFDSIVSLGHFTPAQFGESNLYVVSLARALTTKIDIQDTHEIEEARWIDVAEYLRREDVSAYNQELVKKALEKQNALVQKELELKSKANIQYELFF